MSNNNRHKGNFLFNSCVCLFFFQNVPSKLSLLGAIFEYYNTDVSVRKQVIDIDINVNNVNSFPYIQMKEALLP